MAEYRDQYERIRGAGAELAAVAVDEPARSEAVRKDLRLPYPILCDTGRKLISTWGILNSREKGGIAIPAVFVIDPDRRVRFRSVDSEASRVPTATLVAFLASGMKAAPDARRKFTLPRFGDWLRALQNTLRHGLRSSKT